MMNRQPIHAENIGDICYLGLMEPRIVFGRGFSGQVLASGFCTPDVVNCDGAVSLLGSDHLRKIAIVVA